MKPARLWISIILCVFLLPCADDRAEEAEATYWAPRSSPSHEHQSPAACLRASGPVSPVPEQELLKVHNVLEKGKTICVHLQHVFRLMMIVCITRHSYNKCCYNVCASECLCAVEVLSMLLMVCSVDVSAPSASAPVEPVLLVEEMKTLTTAL